MIVKLFSSIRDTYLCYLLSEPAFQEVYFLAVFLGVLILSKYMSNTQFEADQFLMLESPLNTLWTNINDYTLSSINGSPFPTRGFQCLTKKQTRCDTRASRTCTIVMAPNRYLGVLLTHSFTRTVLLTHHF